MLASLATNCGGASPDQACQKLAQASCNKRATCSYSVDTAGANLQRAFGTMAACVTREALACTNALAAPQTGNSADTIEQCVADYPTYSCADFFDNNPPAACAPSGPRESGSPCAFNAQCATAYCSGTKNALCGTCASPPAAGDACVSSACGHGQLCVAATMVCVAYGASGGSCDADDPCGNGLSCVGAVAASSTPGACQTSVEQLSAACGGTGPGCDGTEGLFCGGASGSKVCMTIAYVGDGMPCGDLSTTSHAECIAGSCYTSTGLAGTGEVGACKGDATDGSPCDTALGPACQTPARCILSGVGTAGTCIDPTGSACG